MTLQRILSLLLLVIYMSRVEGDPVRVPAAADENKLHHAEPMHKTELKICIHSIHHISRNWRVTCTHICMFAIMFAITESGNQQDG